MIFIMVFRPEMVEEEATNAFSGMEVLDVAKDFEEAERKITYYQDETKHSAACRNWKFRLFEI